MPKDCDKKQIEQGQQQLSTSTSTIINNNKIAYYILIILSIIEILIGLFAIIITLYYEISLSKYFYSNEKNQLQDELFFMIIFGIQLIITFIIGLILSKKLICDLYTMHFGLLLTIWNLYNYLFIIYGILMCLMLYRSLDAILNLAETSLLDGISEYSTDNEWRLIWDTMQINRKCCGANSYQDWEKYLLQINDDDDNDLGGPGECNNDHKRDCFKNTTSTPYSCCKLGGYCLNSDNNEPSQDNGNNICDLPIVNIAGINTRGCLDLFIYDISTFITIIFIILSVAFVLQCLVLWIMRRLYVKMKNYSLSTNDCDSDDNCTPAIVVVKCPRNVKCVTVPNDEGSDEDMYNFQRRPKTCSDSCQNYCCNNGSQLLLH